MGLGLAAGALVVLAGSAEEPSVTPPSDTVVRPTTSTSTTTSSTTTTTTTTIAPARAALAELTLAQKVGQLLVAQFPGEPDESVRQLLRDGVVGSVFIAGRSGNVVDVDQTRALTASLQAEADAGGLPGLLVATDQEGGRVQQIALEGMTRFPAARRYGEIADEQGLAAADHAVRADHQQLADELAALGINVDLAPVADVNIVGDRGAIGDRSFSADAATAATLTAAATEGLAAGGVAGTAKHFPGHGPTAVDSHRQLPVVDRSTEEWWAADAVPFEAAIEADVPLVMVGHLFYPALDPHPEPRPASLSPAVVTDVLRAELGYRGVVITDDLGAMAPVAELPVREVAVAAVAAGVDLLLTPSDVEAAHAALVDAVRRRDLDRATINAAVSRVLRLKDALGLLP